MLPICLLARLKDIIGYYFKVDDQSYIIHVG